MPVPSSRTVIGSNVIASGSLIHTFGASASHALSTSSYKACSVDRYVSPSKVAKRGSTWKFACRDCTATPSVPGYPFKDFSSTQQLRIFVSLDNHADKSRSDRNPHETL